MQLKVVTRYAKRGDRHVQFQVSLLPSLIGYNNRLTVYVYTIAKIMFNSLLYWSFIHETV